MASTEEIPATPAETQPASQIEELEKSGELNSVLEKEFDAAEGNIPGDKNTTVTPPETPTEEPASTEEPAKEGEPDPVQPEQKLTPAQKRFAKLLEQRNEARREAVELKEKLATQESETLSDEDAAAEKAAERVIDRRAAKADRLNKIYTDEPLAKDYSEAIQQTLDKFPSMSEAAAWTFVKGAHDITSEQAQRQSTTQQAGVSAGLTPSHLAPIDPSAMSTDDLTKSLKDAEASGQLADI